MVKFFSSVIRDMIDGNLVVGAVKDKKSWLSNVKVKKDICLKIMPLYRYICHFPNVYIKYVRFFFQKRNKRNYVFEYLLCFTNNAILRFYKTFHIVICNKWSKIDELNICQKVKKKHFFQILENCDVVEYLVKLCSTRKTYFKLCLIYMSIYFNNNNKKNLTRIQPEETCRYN